MEFEEREKLNRKIYYHEGVLEYYKKKLIDCKEEDKEDILKSIEKEEDILYDLST
jgi:hypothetical protein